MEYQTGNYKFIKKGCHIVVYVNGEKWGVPQGSHFIEALLEDINNLSEENTQLETELMMLR